MGLTVFHAGQDISQYVIELNDGQLSDHGAGGSTDLQIESVLGQGAGTGFGGSGHQTTCTFACWLGPVTKAIGANAVPSGTDLVRQGEVQVYDATGTPIFGGYVSSMDDATESLSPKTIITAVDYWAHLDRIQVFELYTGRSDTYMIKDLLTKYAPWIDQTLLPVTDQYVWTKFPAKGSLREVIQKMVDTVGWHVWVDATKHIHYVSPTSASTAPFGLSDDADSVATQGYNLTKYTVDDSSIINRVYFYGGKNTSPDFDQDLSVQANGTNTTFSLLYFPHDAGDGKVHVIKNGVELAVGSPFDTSASGKLKSQGGTSDVLLNRDSEVLQFDVAPAKTDTLICRYRYQTPLVVVLSSTTSFNYFGEWFDGKITDTNTFDPNIAMQRCRVLLSQQSFGLTTLSLTTWSAGLQAGQLVRVTNSIRGIDDTFLIQKVTTKPLGGGNFEYDIDLGAWNWNLVDMIMQAARILNPQDSYSEEDMSIIQAKEQATAASVTIVFNKSVRTSGQYYARTAAVGDGHDAYPGFFSVTS